MCIYVYMCADMCIYRGLGVEVDSRKDSGGWPADGGFVCAAYIFPEAPRRVPVVRSLTLGDYFRICLEVGGRRMSWRMGVLCVCVRCTLFGWWMRECMRICVHTARIKVW